MFPIDRATLVRGVADSPWRCSRVTLFDYPAVCVAMRCLWYVVAVNDYLVSHFGDDGLVGEDRDGGEYLAEGPGLASRAAVVNSVVVPEALKDAGSMLVRSLDRGACLGMGSPESFDA